VTGSTRDPVTGDIRDHPWQYSSVSDSADLVIDARGVVVRRGSAVLLDHIDWHVELDERWVVLGPNGAGKTTLLNLAAGRSHPSGGTLRLLDEQLGKVDVFELRPRIGISTAALAESIPGDETVADVVVTAAWAVLGRGRENYETVDEIRARVLLEQFGIDGLSDRRYGTLSEGERKRVQIARALMTDPELLLLDEPAAGLDLGARERLVATLAELAFDADAPALVLVTHHVEEIPPGFTHVLLLNDGAVVASGLLDDVLTSQNLSTTFGLPLRLDRHGDRFSARAV
jgi:iron complex transport system ATP-binding protein